MYSQWRATRGVGGGKFGRRFRGNIDIDGVGTHANQSVFVGHRHTDSVITCGSQKDGRSVLAGAPYE